eukprot:69577-Chlamydomonas_euryale.AAC.1
MLTLGTSPHRPGVPSCGGSTACIACAADLSGDRPCRPGMPSCGGTPPISCACAHLSRERPHGQQEAADVVGVQRRRLRWKAAWEVGVAHNGDAARRAHDLRRREGQGGQGVTHQPEDIGSSVWAAVCGRQHVPHLLTAQGASIIESCEREKERPKGERLKSKEMSIGLG